MQFSSKHTPSVVPKSGHTSNDPRKKKIGEAMEEKKDVRRCCRATHTNHFAVVVVVIVNAFVCLSRGRQTTMPIFFSCPAVCRGKKKSMSMSPSRRKELFQQLFVPMRLCRINMYVVCVLVCTYEYVTQFVQPGNPSSSSSVDGIGTSVWRIAYRTPPRSRRESNSIGDGGKEVTKNDEVSGFLLEEKADWFIFLSPREPRGLH